MRRIGAHDFQHALLQAHGFPAVQLARHVVERPQDFAQRKRHGGTHLEDRKMILHERTQHRGRLIIGRMRLEHDVWLLLNPGP